MLSFQFGGYPQPRQVVDLPTASRLSGLLGEKDFDGMCSIQVDVNATYRALYSLLSLSHWGGLIGSKYAGPITYTLHA